MSWHLEKLAWNPELADLGSSALESTVPDTEQEEAQQKPPFDPVCSPPHTPPLESRKGSSFLGEGSD